MVVGAAAADADDGPTAGAEAFGVYQTQIATDLAAENARLSSDIARCRNPLRALVASVELRTSDGEIAIPFRGLDTAVEVNDGRSVRCERFPGPVRLEIPLRKLASDRDTKLYVSGQCAGNFPAMRSNPRILDVDLNRKFVTMTILDDAGKIGLCGTVTNLTEEDLSNASEETFGLWLQGPEEFTWTSPDAVFTPTHVEILILMNGHPDVWTLIRILQRAPGSDREISPLDESRREAFSVTHNPHHEILMETNLRLKAEQKQLNDMQNLFEEIGISDGAGNEVATSVTRGFAVDGDGGWSVVLPSECDFIDMSTLHDMRVSVSGVRLRKSAASFTQATAFNANFGPQYYFLNIEFDTGVTVIGCLDMGRELDEHYIEVMETDVLPDFLNDVVDGERPRLNFRECTFSLRSVHFKYRWDTLMGGIWGNAR
ncbi:hypothetical protein ACHAXT_003132 [Thalassiosira profunda]